MSNELPVLCVCDVHRGDALCSRALSLVACSRDRLWQIFSLLEVVHAAVGLVGAKVMTTLLQVVSRIFIVWMIMIVVPTSPTVDMRTSFCASPPPRRQTTDLLSLSHHTNPCCV